MVYDKLDQISLEQLIHANNWQAQYRLITDWGKLISAKPELHQPQYLIKGCHTPAWLAHEVVDNQYRFMFDSHSRVMNGLVAIVLSLANNKTAGELLQLDIAQQLLTAGLEKHLTPSRNNGLQKIIASVYTLAAANN